jgi:hypothetical protein
VEEQIIEAVIERCAGIDVGKKFGLVCVMTGAAKDEPQTQIKKFGTIVSELDRLAAWLVAEGCTHAVMESTGQLLEAGLQLAGGARPSHPRECCRCAEQARTQDRPER